MGLLGIFRIDEKGYIIIKVSEKDTLNAVQSIINGYCASAAFDPYSVLYDKKEKGLCQYTQKTGKVPEYYNEYPIVYLFYSGIEFEDMTYEYKKGNITYDDLDWVYDYSDPDRDLYDFMY